MVSAAVEKPQNFTLTAQNSSGTPPPPPPPPPEYGLTKYIWWLLANVTENAIKVFSSRLASVGRPTIKVEGQPTRIWEISSDWSSYRNGMIAPLCRH